MKTYSLMSVLILLIGIGYCQQPPSQSNSQPPGAREKPSWLPKGSYPPYDFFAKLSYARVAADQKVLQIAKPVTLDKTSSREVSKTVMRPEQRQRDEVVNGVTTIKTYTVAVPYTETAVETFSFREAVDSQKIDIPLGKIRAWELSGKELSAAELIKRLSKPTQVLVYELSSYQLAEHQFEAVDPFFGGVIRMDTIAVFCPQELTATAPSPIPAPQPVAPVEPAQPSR